MTTPVLAVRFSLRRGCNPALRIHVDIYDPVDVMGGHAAILPPWGLVLILGVAEMRKIPADFEGICRWPWLSKSPG